MYGHDGGNLTASISQYSGLLLINPEISVIWSTASPGVRTWQYQQIEMKAARTFSVSVE
jgi:hypothetical protein